MSIGPIGGFRPLVPPTVPSTGGGTTAAGPDSTGSATGKSFAAQVAAGIDKVQGLQNTSDSLAQAAATGDLTDVHDYMIASTKATLATELTVAVRNKALDAFNEIMRMPL